MQPISNQQPSNLQTAAQTTPLTNSSSSDNKQRPNQLAPTAITPTQALKQQAPIRYQQAIKIRPIDDPATWLKILKGEKSTAVSTRYKQMMPLIDAASNSQDLTPLLDLCDQDPAVLAIVIAYGKHQTTKNRQAREQNMLTNIEGKLEQQYKDQINGGLNSAKAFAMYSQDGEVLQNLRQAYYSNIIGKRSVNALFVAMLELLGEQQLPSAMATMQKALNDDLFSNYPSTKVTPQMSALITDAGLVNQLISLFGSCGDLLKKITQNVTGTNMTHVEFTRRVVNMTTSSFYLRELQRLNQDCAGPDPLKQLIFLNYYYPMLKKLPDALWPDLQQRNNTLISVLRYMDQQTLTHGQFLPTNKQTEQSDKIKTKLSLQAGVPVITTQQVAS